MITLEIEEKKLLIQVPESWDEMTELQVHYCLKLAAKMLAGEISEDLFRLKCFYKLAGIKRNWRTVMWEQLVSEERLLQKNSNAWRLSYAFTDFMFKVKEQPEGEEQLDNQEQIREFAYEPLINFFPCFKVGFTTFHGPGTLLTDISFGEFRTALEELNTYFETKDEHQLSLLFAVLYRPARKNLRKFSKRPDFDGKIKAPFNLYHQEQYAKKLDKLPGWQRMAMLLHFTWCISYIKKEDLKLGGSFINFSPLFPKSKLGSGKAKASTGWSGVLFGIAEKGIFGNIQQANDANLFDVLLLLYDNYLQGEEIKRQSNKSKKK